MSEPLKLFSRPRDKSLEAYKGWINGIFTAITGRQPEESETREEVWIAKWKAFWSKAEEGKTDEDQGGKPP